MTPEDFQQNNEHGGYPMFAQLAPKPVKRWLFVALVLIALGLALVAAMMTMTTIARSAQLACGPLPLLLKQLADRYHEFVVMSGNNADGHQMLVTRSGAGTFTVLLGDGKGACVILLGKKSQFDNGT